MSVIKFGIRNEFELLVLVKKMRSEVASCKMTA